MPPTFCRQGPITVFIHHNTLHAFEDLPFTDAVQKGAAIFGCQPYLSEDRYRDELRRGRIRFADLQAALRDDLGERGDQRIDGITRFELRLAMLQYPLRHGPTEELLWFVAETDALRRIRPEVSGAIRARLTAETRRWAMGELRAKDIRSSSAGRRGVASGLADLRTAFRPTLDTPVEEWEDDAWEHFTLQALWRVCCDGLSRVNPLSQTEPTPIRHRDLLLQAAGVDADGTVHEVLIGFCAAFLDQGLASWELPCREEGLYRSFVKLYRQAGACPEPWRRELARELTRLDARQVDPLDSIRESLDVLGVSEGEWDAYLSATLLALPGWAGMVHQVECRGDAVRHPIARGSLMEFVAVRLLLDRFALAGAADEALGYSGPLRGLRAAARERVAVQAPPSVEQRAFLVFQLPRCSAGPRRR